MTVTVVAIFVIVYLGMIRGGLPFLQLDRTGAALLGAIALMTIGDVTPELAARSIHLPTLLLLMNRKLHSTSTLGLVDWELLILFIGVFVVNHAFEQTGLTRQAVQALAAHGFALTEPAPLFVAVLLLSAVLKCSPRSAALCHES